MLGNSIDLYVSMGMTEPEKSFLHVLVIHANSQQTAMEMAKTYRQEQQVVVDELSCSLYNGLPQMALWLAREHYESKEQFEAMVNSLQLLIETSEPHMAQLCTEYLREAVRQIYYGLVSAQLLEQVLSKMPRN